METLFVQSLDVNVEPEDVTDPLMVNAFAPKVLSCGRVDMETNGNFKIYKLKCLYCNSEFKITDGQFFIEHLEKNHAQEDLITNIKHEIVEKDVEYEIKEDESNEINNTDITERCDEIHNTDSCEGSNFISELKSTEPKAKRYRKDSSISLSQTDKDIVLYFLNLIKSYSILWCSRKAAPERYDEALKEFCETYNQNYGKEKQLTEEQIRKSISDIKDLYKRVIDCTHKRHVKNPALKEKYSEYFSICEEIVAKSETISSKCEVCGISFLNSIELQVHRFRLHQLGDLPFQCKMCGAGFSKLWQLSVHEKKQHIDKIFNCAECSASFDHKEKLQKHITCHIQNKYVCELCGKTFSSQWYFNRHKVHHLPPQVKCEICGKMLYNKYTLSEHMKTHRNVREYMCNICNKTFNTQNGLSIHRRQVHKLVTKGVWANTPTGIEFQKIECEYKSKSEENLC